jgi:hypothetical protein
VIHVARVKDQWLVAVTAVMFQEQQRISSPAEQLLASQEGTLIRIVY